MCICYNILSVFSLYKSDEGKGKTNQIQSGHLNSVVPLYNREGAKFKVYGWL